MKYQSTCIIIILVLLHRSLFSQQGPAPEIDLVVRATVEQLMKPDASDLQSYIQNHYSENLKASKSLDSLKAEFRLLIEKTRAARAVDVSMDNDLFRIRFSEGTMATVILEFDPHETARIGSIYLQDVKESSQLAGKEEFNVALEATIRKIESLSKYSSDDDYAGFIEANFTDQLRSAYPDDTLIALLRKTGVSVATAMNILVQPLEDTQDLGAIIQLRGPKSLDVRIAIEEHEPYLISKYELNQNIHDDARENDLISMAWTDYQKKVEQEVNKGFSGFIFLVHNGEIKLAKGFGFADKDLKRVHSDETVFDIGSIPIDFTRAAVLKLIDEGALRPTDVITKFFDQVPDDKKQITIDQLMTNRSGLQNFHHDEAIDQDHDLTWIDRDVAIQRILSRPLLAEPGTENIPSHSAYGLLAAIVEIVSGHTYDDYLSLNFFSPMGLRNTGPFGKASGIPKERFAIGYGKRVSMPNVPSEWGKTSWLVKGSGGMVSNPLDLYTWYNELQTKNYLSSESKEKYGFGKIALGGSERGYLTGIQKDAANTVIICANVNSAEYPDTFRLFKSLLELLQK